MATRRATREGQTVRGTPENDTLFGLGGAETLLGRQGNDGLLGRAGNDRLFGEAGNDRLFGEAGNDQLRGGSGNDRLDGGAGNDRLFGDAGNDRLLGGGGNDTLDGGAGRDILTGGAGRDRFNITSISGGPDTITDYARGVDTLNLRPLLADFGQSGDLLDDFVRARPSATGVLVRVNLDGSGTDFVPVARLLGLGDFDDPTPRDFGLPVPGTPVVDQGIDDRRAHEGEIHKFTVPANAFRDPDGDNLTYTFRQTNGDDLPDWLTVRADGFSGEPGKFDGGATHNIRVTASDGQASASTLFDLVVTADTPINTGDYEPKRPSTAGNSDELDRFSENPAISHDGRFVAYDFFQSGEDADGTLLETIQSVFVNDIVLGERTRVSPRTEEIDGELHNAAEDPTISATGQFVAYEITVDPNAITQIDMVDLTQAEVFIPVARGNGPSSNPDIAGDGTRIVFQSDASDLPLSDGSGTDGDGTDIFLRDFLDNSLILISTGAEGDSTDPSISQDGRYIAFENGGDILVHDTTSGGIVRIEAPNDPDDPNLDISAASPDISGDGRLLVFETISENGPRNVYLADVSEPGSEVLHVAQLNEPSVEDDINPYTSASPSISADGRFLSYVAPNDDGLELLVRELSAGGNLLGSGPRAVAESTDLRQSVLSGDGSFDAFVSRESLGGFGNGNEEGSAVFVVPTEGGFDLTPTGLEAQAVTLAEVVDDSEDVLGPASSEVDPPPQNDPPASSAVDGGSATMSLDQVLSAPPDEVMA